MKIFIFQYKCFNTKWNFTSNLINPLEGLWDYMNFISPGVPIKVSILQFYDVMMRESAAASV